MNAYRIFCLLFMLMLGDSALATNYTFPGSLPAGCTGSSGAYTCSALALGYGDTITIASPKPASITINGDFSTNTSTINTSGLASDLAITVTGVLTTAWLANINANITANSISDLGGYVTFGGSLTSTGSIALGYQNTVVGSITSSTGAITVGQNGTVNGSVNSASGAIDIGNAAHVSGDITTSSTVSLGISSVAYACVKSTGSAAITLGSLAEVNSVCCGSSCSNSCVNNSLLNSLLNNSMPSTCPASSAATLLAEYHLDEFSWSGTSGEVKDTGGNSYNGQASGSPLPIADTTTPVKSGAIGTCGYAKFTSSFLGGGVMTLPGLSTNTTAGAKTTVSFWMYWDGTNDAIPIGWASYNLWFYSSYFGFHTGNTDIYGVSSSTLANGWHHIVAEFNNKNITNNRLYIDGAAQTLTQKLGIPSSGNSVVSSTLNLSDPGLFNYQRFQGNIDEVKIYNGTLTQAQVTALFNETHSCPDTLLTSKINVDNGFIAYLSTDDAQQGSQFGLSVDGSGYEWRTTVTSTKSLSPCVDYYLHIYGYDRSGVAGFLGQFTLFGSTHEFSNKSNTLLTNGTDWLANGLGWSSPYSTVTVWGTNSDPNNPWYASNLYSKMTSIADSAQWIWSGNWDTVNNAYFSTKISAKTAGCPLHHIRLEHTGSGITCAANSISVKACKDAACTPGYTGTTTVTLSSSPTGSWATNPITFTGDSTPASLSVTSAQTVTIGTSSVSPAATSATDCLSGASTTCQLAIADSGFTFTVPDHVAETQQTISINSAGCSTKFSSSTKSLVFKCSYTNPTTGTLPIRIATNPLNSTNNAAAACDTSGKAISIGFDANGIGSTTLLYADVGKMNLSATYTGSLTSNDVGLVMTGNDDFIAAPASFGFSGITATPIKAGANFSATVTAKNALGNTTPNFGKETAPEGVTLAHQLVSPTGSGAITGTLTGAVGSFNNGLATSSSLTYSEVGLINLIATLTSNNYLGSGFTATGTSTNAVEFVPHHFTTNVIQGCPSGSFTYSGQPFSTTITALNAGNAITKNYDGSSNTSPNYAKTVTLAPISIASLGSISPSTFLPNSFTAGFATVNPTFSFSSRTTPPSAIAIRANDINASSSGYAEGVLNVYSGRLALQNASGSELLDLPISLTTQYWGTGGYYQTNTSDNCTQIPVPTSANGGLNFTGSTLSAGQTSATLNGLASGNSTVVAGDGLMTLTKPGVGNTGFVDMTLNAPTWLEFPWHNAGNLDPTARASFGLYKGDIKQIYLRELY